MKTIKVNSANTLSEAIGELRKKFKEKGYFTLTINTGKNRTLSQNALSHVWYDKVAKEEGEYDVEGVKCLCKFHKGLPILRATDAEINEYCVAVIDLLPYEAKIEAMKFLPVTSRMNTEQLTTYLEAVQANYSGRVDLQFPEDEK